LGPRQCRPAGHRHHALQPDGLLFNSSRCPTGNPAGHPREEHRGGSNHTCIVDGVGATYCWGASDSGQTGDVSNIPTPKKPHVVAGLGTAAAVASGGNATCVILEPDGSVYCFGANNFGQLARADDNSDPKPGPVANVRGATAIAVGSDHV